jgi:molybdopterin-binding protein
MIVKVKEIEYCDSLHIIRFDFRGEVLSMMSLDISDNIKIGTRVKLVVKPTHIAIAKKFSGDVSYSNQLPCTIKSINNGKLLSSIKLSVYDTVLESIITVNSSQKMNLKVGDEVIAFVKASELSIGEVLDD